MNDELKKIDSIFESLARSSQGGWSQLPKKGDKMVFCGTKNFWFKNIVKDAEDLLMIGVVYTVESVAQASSWTAVELQEFKGKEFSLSWFNKQN